MPVLAGQWPQRGKQGHQRGGKDMPCALHFIRVQGGGPGLGDAAGCSRGAVAQFRGTWQD